MTAIAHLRSAAEAIRAMGPRDVRAEYPDMLAEIGALTAALHEASWAVDGAGEALAELRRVIVKARARTTRGYGMGRLGEGGKGGGGP